MIYLHKGDITSVNTDGIVNAANNILAGGGGVDGAIHRAAGPSVADECKKWVKAHGKLPTGEAMITGAGELSAKNIIHTVGPVWKGGTGGEDQQLANCYINSLHLAIKNQLQSLAFPNISTGVYAYPKADAAEMAITTVQNFCNSFPDAPEVHFVCFDQENFEFYKSFESTLTVK